MLSTLAGINVYVRRARPEIPQVAAQAQFLDKSLQDHDSTVRIWVRDRLARHLSFHDETVLP
jgi:hypothetical protein